MNFPPLQLPPCTFRVKKNAAGEVFIFDISRKKFLLLQPEEYVRQHLLHFLHFKKGYPLSLIKIEQGIHLHQRAKRSDIIVYRSDGQINLLIECKAPDIPIEEKTWIQAMQYNLHYKADWILLSNGNTHWIQDQGSKTISTNLDFIPPFQR